MWDLLVRAGFIALAERRISTRRLTELVVCSGRDLEIRLFPLVAKLRGKYGSASPVRYDSFGCGRGPQTTAASDGHGLQTTVADSPRGLQPTAGMSGANVTGKKNKISPASRGLLARALPVHKRREERGVPLSSDLPHDSGKGGWE